MFIKRNFIFSILITVIFISFCVVYYKKQEEKYNIDGFVHKASHYFKNKNYLLAVRYYKKLISMDYVDESVYTNTAISMMKLGYYQKAINQLLMIEKEMSPSSEVYYLLAYCHFLKAKENNNKNFDISVQYLEKSIEAESRNKNSYMLIGRIYEDTNMYEKARKWYRQALFEDMDNSSEFYGLIANTYFKENKFEDAIKYYNRAIENNKNYISAYYSIAEIYKKQEKYDEAEEYYKKTIQMSPDYVYPYYQTGNLYFEKKEYDVAIDWYKKALKIEPNDEFVNYYIGIAYKEQNNLKEAIEHLKIAAYCGNDDAVKELRKLSVKF
ncbi:MAG: tetratricopeptide repeat protein [Endomicrobiaceae bacterium]|nr:tetratricopeptide repeat protein [Endomicrobiaceae bacterium]